MTVKRIGRILRIAFEVVGAVLGLILIGLVAAAVALGDKL